MDVHQEDLDSDLPVGGAQLDVWGRRWEQRVGRKERNVLSGSQSDSQNLLQRESQTNKQPREPWQPKTKIAAEHTTSLWSVG